MKRTVKYLIFLCALSGSAFSGKPTISRLADSYKKAGVRVGDVQKYVAMLNEALRHVQNEEGLVAAIFECIPNSIKNRHNQVKMMESIEKQVHASVAAQGFKQIQSIAKAVLSNHLIMYRCRPANFYPDRAIRLQDYAGKSVEEILADLE